MLKHLLLLKPTQLFILGSVSLLTISSAQSWGYGQETNHPYKHIFIQGFFNDQIPQGNKTGQVLCLNQNPSSAEESATTLREASVSYTAPKATPEETYFLSPNAKVTGCKSNEYPFMFLQGTPKLRLGPINTLQNVFIYEKMTDSYLYDGAPESPGRISIQEPSVSFNMGGHTYTLEGKELGEMHYGLSLYIDGQFSQEIINAKDASLDNIQILWAGDLDYDDKPDFYLEYNNGAYNNEIAQTLFLSSLGRGKALGVAAKTVYSIAE